MTFKTATTVALCVVLTLGGCSVAEIRGKAPTNVDECEANWLQETGAVAHDAFEIKNDTRADNAVAAFLIAVSRLFMDPHVSHARYRDCLASVGVTDVRGYLQTNSDQAIAHGVTTSPVVAIAPPKRPSYCPPGAGVLYGGAGYCVGR